MSLSKLPIFRFLSEQSIPERKTAGLDELLAKWQPTFLSLPYPYISLDFQTFEIVWNYRMRSRAGLCRPFQKIIELNPHLLKEFKDLEEVLVHEICHMAVSRRWPHAQAHGQKWQKLMSLCGMEPKRCHSLVPVKRHAHRRWDLSCACQTHNVTTLILNRIKKGARYKCRQCGEPLKVS